MVLRTLGYLVALIAVAVAVTVRTFVTNPIKFQPVDLTNKVCLVTGSSTGIGLTTVQKLAEWGCQLELPLRSKVKETEAAIRAVAPNAKIRTYPGVDFSKLKTVKAFAEAFLATGTKVDIVINNAGLSHLVVGPTTVDGIEETFQVNHIAPHLLTEALIPALKPTGARVIFVSSAASFSGHVDKELYSFEAKGKPGLALKPLARYDTSKLLNVLATKYFAQKHPSIIFASVHPGFVKTELTRTLDPIFVDIVSRAQDFIARDALEGAVAQVTLATHPKLTLRSSGKFYMDYCIEDLCTTCAYFCDHANGGYKPNAEAEDPALIKWLEAETSKYVKAVT